MNASPLLLVDSYAQIYRGFYAVRALTNSAGAPSNAVFAFSKFISRLDADSQGSDGAFIFDLGRSAYRLSLAPDYKANRPPMPEDLRSQLPAIRELVSAYGWPIIEFEGFEADDLIAAIALASQEREVSIVSADKDLSQLIGGRISMLVPDSKDGGLIKRGVEEVKERFGVAPERIADLLALTGDSSDNIQGVDGVGPKTAAQLIEEFGSIDSIIANASKIKRESIRAKIEASKELLERNLKLVKLGSIAPEGVAWIPELFKRRAPDFERIRKIAMEFNLKGLLNELDSKGSETAASSPAPKNDSNLEQMSFSL